MICLRKRDGCEGEAVWLPGSHQNPDSSWIPPTPKKKRWWTIGYYRGVIWKICCKQFLFLVWALLFTRPCFFWQKYLRAFFSHLDSKVQQTMKTASSDEELAFKQKVLWHASGASKKKHCLARELSFGVQLLTGLFCSNICYFNPFYCHHYLKIHWLVVSITSYVHPETLEKWSNLTDIFHMGWNHHVENTACVVREGVLFCFVQLVKRLSNILVDGILL